MGMNMHDRYYIPEDDEDFEELEHEAWKMVQKGGEYDFMTTQAISEMMGELNVEQDKSLQAIIDEGDFEKIGRKIICMAEDYMMGHALDSVGVPRD